MRLIVDYDDDDFYAARPGLWALWLFVIALILWALLAFAQAQDFNNVAGKVTVEVERPVQIGANVTFPIDPLEVLSKQTIDYLCAYIAVLSNARSTPGSAVYVAGQKAQKCIENTAPPESPGGTLPPPVATGTGRIVSFDSATRTLLIETNPPVTHVEILIDSKIVPGWYIGRRAVGVDGQVAVVLDPLVMDGQKHTVEVRAYDNSSGSLKQLASLSNSKTFTFGP